MPWSRPCSASRRVEDIASCNLSREGDREKRLDRVLESNAMHVAHG